MEMSDSMPGHLDLIARIARGRGPDPDPVGLDSQEPNQLFPAFGTDGVDLDTMFPPYNPEAEFSGPFETLDATGTNSMQYPELFQSEEDLRPRSVVNSMTLNRPDAGSSHQNAADISIAARRASKRKRPSDGEDKKDSDSGLDPDEVRKAKNRKAASKCRANKKEKYEALQNLADHCEQQNAELKQKVKDLMAERLQYRNLMLKHARCGDPNIDQWLNNSASSLANNFVVQMPGTFNDVSTPQPPSMGGPLAAQSPIMTLTPEPQLRSMCPPPAQQQAFDSRHSSVSEQRDFEAVCADMKSPAMYSRSIIGSPIAQNFFQTARDSAIDLLDEPEDGLPMAVGKPMSRYPSSRSSMEDLAITGNSRVTVSIQDRRRSNGLGPTALPLALPTIPIRYRTRSKGSGIISSPLPTPTTPMDHVGYLLGGDMLPTSRRGSADRWPPTLPRANSDEPDVVEN